MCGLHVYLHKRNQSGHESDSFQKCVKMLQKARRVTISLVGFFFVTPPGPILTEETNP